MIDNITGTAITLKQLNISGQLCKPIKGFILQYTSNYIQVPHVWQEF